MAVVVAEMVKRYLPTPEIHRSNPCTANYHLPIEYLNREDKSKGKRD